MQSPGTVYDTPGCRRKGLKQSIELIIKADKKGKAGKHMNLLSKLFVFKEISVTVCYQTQEILSSGTISEKGHLHYIRFIFYFIFFTKEGKHLLSTSKKVHHTHRLTLLYIQQKVMFTVPVTASSRGLNAVFSNVLT